MSYEELTLSSIEVGNLEDAVNDALREIAQDVVQRPSVKKPRKVMVEITLKSDVTDGPGGVQRNVPEVDWKVEHRVPGHRGMTTRAFVDGDRVLVNTGDPTGTNPNQRTIFDEEKEKQGQKS